MNAAAEQWIRAHVSPVAGIETGHERPWAAVSRVSVPDGVVWFKECAPVQGFEPALTAALFGRWPDRMPEVLAHDVSRRWLLLADAGMPVGAIGNPPSVWLEALPLYAELQRAEAAHVDEHLAAGVPDLRVGVLPACYSELLARDLPLSRDEVESLRRFTPRFVELCASLDAHGVPPSVQHDDLHMNNLFVDDGRLRFLDWGDASISHPFMSLVITFRFLEERNGMRPGDSWFSRLREAYLEPWGSGLASTFRLALVVGAFARAFASVRIRDSLPPSAVPAFDEDFTVVLRRALGATRNP